MRDYTKTDDPKLIADLFSKDMITLGFKLDFSLKSLESEIDNILENFYGCPNELRWELEAKLTAYIGETVCRKLYGSWTGRYYLHDNPNGTNYNSCKIKIDDQDFYPSRFIEHYFSNGKDEGTFKDYFFKSKLIEWNLA